MKQMDDNRLKELITLLMAGETTNDQEREIIDRFRQGPVAEELEQYRPMLLWLDDGMPDMAGRQSSSAAKPRRWDRRMLTACISVAASLALIVTLALSLMTRPAGALSREDYLTYAGSYVIRDGKKITDLDQIMTEIKQAERMVEDVSSQYEIESMDKYINTDNPAVRAALESALSE